MIDSDRRLSATLYELSVFSPAPNELSDFYAKALGYSFDADGDGRVGAAHDRRLRIEPGDAKAMNYACYAVADAARLTGLKQRLEANGAPYRETIWEGAEGPAVEVRDPDGNRFVFAVIGRASGSTFSTAVSARPARLQHVVFASPQAERLLAFYQDVLGFVLTDRVLDEANGLRTAFLRCSEEHHSLAVFSASEARLDHHCLEAGDWGLIRDWADHFSEQRIPLKWGPGRHGPGNNLFIFIHDADGNWVEISAELETVGEERPVGDWPHEERTLNSWGMGLLRS